MSADAVFDAELPVVGPRLVDVQAPGVLHVTLANVSPVRSAVVDLARDDRDLRIVLEPGEAAPITLQPGLVRIKLGHDARLELR